MNKQVNAGGPFAGTVVIDNDITINFAPRDSALVKSCAQIVDIQFVRLYGDGARIAPSTFFSGWDYRDVVMTKAYWWVDFLKGETTPDYQQGGTVGQVGEKTDVRILDAWIPDAPDATSGGDKGFKTKQNPNGWDTIEYEFFTFCWCMKGTQCASWYEGISWKYVKTAKDFEAGLPGRAMVLSDDLTKFPDELREAFELFNTTVGFQPCNNNEMRGQS
jgi:hypothetical protein